METALSITAEESTLAVTYLKTQTLRDAVEIEIGGQIERVENVPRPGQTDLYLLRHALGHDLAVDPASIRFDPIQAGPATPVTLHGTIENRGDLPVENVTARFYFGDPAAGGIAIGEPQTRAGVLNAGESWDLSVPWLVPAGIESIYLVVDPVVGFEDRDRSNNTVGRPLLLPDLVIETCWSTEISSSELVLVARVRNRGSAMSAPTALAWRRVSETDRVEVARGTVPALGPGQQYETAATWDVSGLSGFGRFAALLLEVDAGNAVAELEEGNNTFLQTVPIPAYAPRFLRIAAIGIQGDEIELVIEGDDLDSATVSLESTGSLSPGAVWELEAGAVFEANPEGTVSVRAATQSESRFYRILIR